MTTKKTILELLDDSINNSTLVSNNISSQITVLDENWFEFTTAKADNHLLDHTHLVWTFMNDWRINHYKSIRPALMNLPDQSDWLAQAIKFTERMIISEYYAWMARLPDAIRNLNPLLIDIRDKMIEIDNSIKAILND